MKWYEDLFVGESVTGKIKKIKWKIEHNAGMLHTYIITFPSNEENLWISFRQENCCKRDIRRRICT